MINCSQNEIQFFNRKVFYVVYSEEFGLAQRESLTFPWLLGGNLWAVEMLRQLGISVCLGVFSNARESNHVV